MQKQILEHQEGNTGAQQGGTGMIIYWEYLAILIGLSLVLVLLILTAWLRDFLRWRNIRPYYGRPYDASDSHTYRPNVDLRRTR